MGYTIGERHRTCSYCFGPTYATKELFHEHWIKCPRRIAYGYIPDPDPKPKPPTVNELADALQDMVDLWERVHPHTMLDKPTVAAQNTKKI